MSSSGGRLNPVVRPLQWDGRVQLTSQQRLQSRCVCFSPTLFRGVSTLGVIAWVVGPPAELLSPPEQLRCWLSQGLPASSLGLRFGTCGWWAGWADVS